MAGSVVATLGSGSVACDQSDTVAVTVPGGATMPAGTVSVYDGATRIASARRLAVVRWSPCRAARRGRGRAS